MAQVSAGQWKRAKPLLREYLDAEPTDHRAWTSLARCCDRTGDERGAFEALLSASGPMEREGLLAQAVALWFKMAKLKPADGWPEMKLAELRLALGRRADAVLHYDRAEAIYAGQGRQREAEQARKRLDALASSHSAVPGSAGVGILATAFREVSPGNGTAARRGDGAQRASEPARMAAEPQGALPASEPVGS